MKQAKRLLCVGMAAMLLSAPLWSSAATFAAAEDSVMYPNSGFVETEQPEINEETKRLLALYQRDPSMENYLALRESVIANYESVLAKKEEKLNELLAETAGRPGGTAIVQEMQEIVQEMYITYWNRINSTMLRFGDARLSSWSTANAAQYEYIPVMGAGTSTYIKRTPVTNEEYAQFLRENGHAAPVNMPNAAYAQEEAEYPVNYVSYQDALAYCAWLTERDGENTYRLPSESEWELAAGHIPKDAAFNCGVNDGRTPVEQYAEVTHGAHGAVDLWGNVWEWTSTVRSAEQILGVKGGSWASERTECRTEYRGEGRDGTAAYEDVGFRVICVRGGEEPEQNVELATLAAPEVTAFSAPVGGITLTWAPVEGATEYQLFEYDEVSGLLSMLERTEDTRFVITGLVPGSTHRYIVQPISYVEIADNVSYEYGVAAVAGQAAEEGALPGADLPAETPAPDGAEPQREESALPVILACAAAGGVLCVVVVLLLRRR